MRAYLLAILTATFGIAASARAELAGSGLDPEGNQTYLLYVEGDRVHRYECQSGTAIHDHANCTAKHASAPVSSFFARLPTQFGTSFPDFDKEAREAWVKITQLDDRLFQLVNTVTPHDPSPVTDAEIAKAARAVEKIEVEMVALKDQIGRLQAALSQNGGDPTDLDQLEIDRKKLVKLESARATASEALLAIRQKYVEQRADTSDANLRDLVAMRQRQFEAYNVAKYYGSLEVLDLSCAALMATRIREIGFVWEASCNLQTHYPQGLGNTMNRIGRAFAEAEHEDRTFHGSTNDSRVVNVVVTRPGRLESVKCRYPIGGPSAEFEGYLFIYGPSNMTVQEELNIRGPAVEAGWYRGQSSGAEAYVAAGFNAKSGEGAWRFQLAPHFLVIGDPATLPPAKCSVTLVNPEALN